MHRSTMTQAPRGAISLMYRVYRYVLPEVRRQLAQWKTAAARIPDEELRTQALASIRTKQFHCEGGGVYAAIHLQHLHVLVPLIVAFQTISDYLDNLCDRSTSLDAQDFRMLHQSMLDAVNPDEPLHDYYAFRDEKEDGGYLSQLVRTCQTCICLLPSYKEVQAHIVEWVSLYCDLQVYKHIRHDLREPALAEWWEKYAKRYPQIAWNEFAAATGSTIGVFMLFVAASNQSLPTSDVESIKDAYFPYICSLHILLDYLIDQEEDRIGGDLNFCSYYESDQHASDRFSFIVQQARKACERTSASHFHRMIVEGLLAVYLSDPKAKAQRQVKAISRTLMKNSPFKTMFFWINSMWVRKTIS